MGHIQALVITNDDSISSVVDALRHYEDRDQEEIDALEAKGGYYIMKFDYYKIETAPLNMLYFRVYEVDKWQFEDFEICYAQSLAGSYEDGWVEYEEGDDNRWAAFKRRYFKGYDDCYVTVIDYHS